MIKHAIFAILMIVGISFVVHANTVAKMLATQAALQTDYQRLNDGYFDGNLPQDTIIQYDDPGMKNRMIGWTTILSTETGRNVFVIHVNSFYNPDLRIAEMTEIHEVCHVAEWQWMGKEDDHGPHWEACMKNLAREGGMDDVW